MCILREPNCKLIFCTNCTCTILTHVAAYLPPCPPQGPPEYEPLGCYEPDSSSEDEHKPTEPRETVCVCVCVCVCGWVGSGCAVDYCLYRCAVGRLWKYNVIRDVPTLVRGGGW